MRCRGESKEARSGDDLSETFDVLGEYMEPKPPIPMAKIKPNPDDIPFGNVDDLVDAGEQIDDLVDAGGVDPPEKLDDLEKENKPKKMKTKKKKIRIKIKQ